MRLLVKKTEKEKFFYECYFYKDYFCIVDFFLNVTPLSHRFAIILLCKNEYKLDKR